MGDGTIVPLRRRPDFNRLIATLLQHSRVLAGEAIWHPDDFAAAP